MFHFTYIWKPLGYLQIRSHQVIIRFFPTPVICLFVFVGVFLTTGCSDKCKKTNCEHNGACVDGTCICANGYEGEDCNTEVRAKFIGTYNVSDNCTITLDAKYTVNISAVSDSNLFEVQIANFNNDFSNSVIATIVNGTEIKINSQAPDYDGRVVSGSGQLQGTSLIWNYSINNTNMSQVNSCTSTWDK